MNTKLKIEQKESELVVDSRLIADELGIEHKTLVENIRKNKETVEFNFGRLTVATRTVEQPNGGTREYFSHYWLNEEQATFAMTLSKNTKQVIQCKANLVKAFSKTRKQLQNIQHQLPQTYEDAIIALAEQFKAHKKEVKQLHSQIGNAEQSVRDNLEKFEEHFNEELSLEENIEKFANIICKHKEDIMYLNFQKQQLEISTFNNVNCFLYDKQNVKRLDDVERRIFGKLMKKVCIKNKLPYKERTTKKDGYDLNTNFYPISLLDKIFDLICDGYKHAQIVEIYINLD